LAEGTNISNAGGGNLRFAFALGKGPSHISVFPCISLIGETFVAISIYWAIKLIIAFSRRVLDWLLSQFQLKLVCCFSWRNHYFLCYS